LVGKHNIITADYIENLKVDDYLFAAVEYLADHYQHLHAFYKQLKYHQNIRKNFTHHTSANSISYIKKWCTMLQQHHLIDAFKIENENIYIDIAEVHNATYFIYGYWLELLLRREIAQLLHQHLSHIQSFDIISQASVMLPDKQLTELDLLLMVNNQVYWFECKSGTIQTYYEKFNQHRKIMKLDAQHAFLIIPHRDANIALQTQKRSGMTTLYGIELEQQLQEIIFKN